MIPKRRPTVRPSRALRLAGLAVVVAVALTGCSAADGLSQQYGEGSNKGYISGDGGVTEIKAADRDAPVQFSGTTDDGKSISRKKYEGKVVVLNFWYASCPPCRLEAPDLQALSKKYSGDAQFIGVNVRDQADTARAFARTFKITYPSIIDTNDAKVQLALADQRGGANATPTTIVLDQKGRFAARITGGADKSILDTLIGDTVKGE